LIQAAETEAEIGRVATGTIAAFRFTQPAYRPVRKHDELVSRIWPGDKGRPTTDLVAGGRYRTSADGGPDAHVPGGGEGGPIGRPHRWPGGQNDVAGSMSCRREDVAAGDGGPPQVRGAARRERHQLRMTTDVAALGYRVHGVDVVELLRRQPDHGVFLPAVAPAEKISAVDACGG